MAKPKKLKSGSWNIRAYSHKDENGKEVFVSFTHPDKNECRWMYEQWHKNRDKTSKNAHLMTVRDAVDKYINSSDAILSPSTLQSYRQIQKYGFQELMDTPLKKLTTEYIQTQINNEARRKAMNKNCVISAKTVKNEWSVISAALHQLGMSFVIRLPKYQQKADVLPEPEYVLNAIRGTSVELPCMLALWMSLRLSEIRGLTTESVKGDTLLINQVKIRVGKEDVVKELAKTSASRRSLKIPPYVLDLINKTDAMKEYKRTGTVDYLIPMADSTIRHTVTKVMNMHGLDLSLHDLRHVFASVSLVKLKIADKVVQQNGGWSTSKIMQDIYNNGFNEDQQQAFIKRNEYYDGILSQNLKQKPETLS